MKINFDMEYLLVNTLVEIVGNSTYKHTLCQRRDFTWRNQGIHLRVERMTHILTVDGYGLSFLENLTETLGERLGCLTHNLTGENVADGVHNHGGLLVTVVVCIVLDFISFWIAKLSKNCEFRNG